MSLETRKHFGTDGIRGRVGEYPITPDFILKLGWAAGNVLAEGASHPLVLIGKDTRISGYMFESALEAGLAAAGVNIQLVGPMPTPAIAYLTRTFRASAGIVISASHNPHMDNGIKFFSANGLKLDDEIEMLIERELVKSVQTVSSDKLGRASRITDAAGRYIEFCKSTIPQSMDLKGRKIVLDCANGATYHIAPHVFEELGADVFCIGCEPNGLNINDGVGATMPERLRSTVLEKGADLGIAFDGDGDRVVMVDCNGDILDGDELIYVLARSRSEKKTLRGPVVGTVMSNFGMEVALRELGVEMVRAPVGDRYVSEWLARYRADLGGESSGHIICRDKTTTGDGVVSALQILACVWESGRDLNDLRNGMKKSPQILINIPLKERIEIDEIPALSTARAYAETRLRGCGRVLLRSSGTEPLVRVMVEGEDLSLVEEVCAELADSVRLALCDSDPFG